MNQAKSNPGDKPVTVRVVNVNWRVRSNEHVIWHCFPTFHQWINVQQTKPTPMAANERID
jgi:hypothetical protein